MEQPNEDIPVFVVRKVGNRLSKRRTLHRNLLLPVNFLPLDSGAGKTPKDAQIARKKQSKAKKTMQNEDPGSSSEEDSL